MSIFLQSADGMLFEVKPESVKCSETINDNLEKMENGNKEAIQLEGVNSFVLNEVLEWANHHKDDPNPASEKNNDRTDQPTVFSVWDTAFFAKQNPGDLFELILAANYLKIEGLLDMATQRVKGMIKGKSVEEIRTAFNIINDFSAEEYIQVLKENEWCEQN